MQQKIKQFGLAIVEKSHFLLKKSQITDFFLTKNVISQKLLVQIANFFCTHATCMSDSGEFFLLDIFSHLVRNGHFYGVFFPLLRIRNES